VAALKAQAPIADQPSMTVEPPADWGLLARPAEPAPALVIFPAQDRGRWWPGALALAFVAIGAVLAVSLAGGSVTPSSQSAARTINLRLADLPGFEATASGAQLAGFADPAAERCVAVPAGSASALASPAFVAASGPAQELVQSSVAVTGSPSAAGAALRAMATPSVAGCLAAALAATATIDGQTVSLSGARVQSLPFAPAGSGGGFAYAATATATGASGVDPVWFEIEGFAAGSTVVSLTTSSLAQPFPATLATHLQSLLLARSLPHAGGVTPSAPSPPPSAPSGSASSSSAAG
jgi:hypothetical protein